MGNEKNKGFEKGGKGANPSTARYRTSAAGRNKAEISILFSIRYYEILKLWHKTGHWWTPTPVEILEFLEGEL